MTEEHADSRTILKLSGDDARAFLQGLVTNDVDRLSEGIVYAALLTPQGKLISDFFLVEQADAILIDAPAERAPTLFQRLSLYKLRSNVAVEQTDLTVQRGLGTPPEGAYADPRHPALGWRAYGQSEMALPSVDWDALRVAHLIPEWGTELDEDTFILEAGFERLNGVDFRKGCYVGQEVTARMKHKTELRKGFARVAVTGDGAAGTPIETADQKPAGRLHTRAGNEAIAYLRFDRAEGPMTAGEASVSRL
ncbi:hypothetical protein SAMN05421688_2262 [Poseidonocella pacifica]|uniref:CAF17 C-terminal domain-containing protein n=1 Tax=Poseidonocella pacifica TaxID=871651 RepID=A0A1I0XGX9_9RHOB|nr:folate-binding protein YgfZ [Poseidonocella pacifica]SFB00231.1 hypothetical protein SAMN05421688_2262 [Poseidonocella pacifica]